MKIQDYIQVLKRRGWLIGLIAILTAGSALGFSLIQAPVYRSSVDIGIQAARTDWGLAQTVKILLDSYVTVMHTRPWAERVIEDLDLMLEPDVLLGDVIIASDSQNLTIQIDVDSNDGEQANRIAKRWAELLVQWRDSENQKQQKEDRVFAQILQEPTYRLLRPKWKINTAAGAVFGLLLGALAVIALEWFDAGIIRTPRALEEQTGLTVVGIIPPITPTKR
ncbi:MAG: Chain length determinant protein [Chloroflexi bacterium ADurb.Bin360]|nr:MAG: Chain length determinant protein [Chloroflexi bacterium ADurb.Bin360]